MLKATSLKLSFTLWLPLALGLAVPMAQGEELQLETMTCGQLSRLNPESIQTSVIGLSVGYAMGQEGAPFDLEVANAWFTAFRDFCKLAPDTRVAEVMAAIAEQVEDR